MDKSELHNIIIANIEKSVSENQVQVTQEISAVSKAIRNNLDLDKVLFDFYMSAVLSATKASIETFIALETLKENPVDIDQI